MYDLKDLVLQVKNFIPCEECKSEWYDPAPEQNLLDWSRELHNKVNTKLGRYDKWDARDLLITHKPHCDICEEKEFIHRYPWVFIHFVALQPNSMDFLKAFNAQYPCEKHRGTFLDEPQPEESTTDWVLRNNKKIDPNFVIPPYMLPQPVQTPAFDPVTGQPILDPITGKQMVSVSGGPPVACATCSSATQQQQQQQAISMIPQAQDMSQVQSIDPLPATITVNQTVTIPSS
jgi:hypothetical protein